MFHALLFVGWNWYKCGVWDMQEQVIPGLFASGEIAVAFMMLTGITVWQFNL